MAGRTDGAGHGNRAMNKQTISQRLRAIIGSPKAARKRLFIHAGLYKTGTSSFQRTIYDHRAQLAEHGILYPETGLGLKTNHNRYAHRLLGIDLTSKGTSALPQLLEQFSDQEDCHTALLSYEGFCHPDAVGKLQAQQRIFDNLDVHGMLVFRPHVDYAISLYRELCQHLSMKGPISDLFPVMDTPPKGYWQRTMWYEDIVRHWHTFVGHKNLHIWSYPEIKADITNSLLSAISKEKLAFTTAPAVNPTLSAPAAELMRRVNGSNLPSAVRHPVAQHLHQLDKANPDFKAYCELAHEDALQLEARYSKDIEYLEKLGVIGAEHLTVASDWKWGDETDMADAVEHAEQSFPVLLEEAGEVTLAKTVRDALSAYHNTNA